MKQETAKKRLPRTGRPIHPRVHGCVHGSSGQKAIRKFSIVGVRKKKIAGSNDEKQGGASEPSPGGRFPRSPLAEVGHRRPFFRRHVVVLLCGWDVAAPRGRLRPSGGRESPLFAGGVLTKIFSKIKNVTTTFTTTLAYYIIRILSSTRVGNKLATLPRT